MNIVARVRYSRNCTNDTFPLPSVTNCLRYAITEMAEFDDARLRQQQPEHLRNHARNDDPRRELGQCGYMLASAWVQITKQDEVNFNTPHETRNIDHMYAGALADIAFALEDDGAQSSVYFAISAWVQLCGMLGWNADQLIEETCAEFERKHCVTREVQ